MAAPNVMWGTDMTSTVVEGAACVFVAVDHCTIGLHAEARFDPIRQGVRLRPHRRREGLRLRHDHGSPG